MKLPSTVILGNSVSLDTQGGANWTVGPGNFSLTGSISLGALGHTSEIDTVTGTTLTLLGDIGTNTAAALTTLRVGGQSNSVVELTGQIAKNVVVVAVPHGTIAYGPNLTISGILESNGGSLILKGANPQGVAAALFHTPPGVQIEPSPGCPFGPPRAATGCRLPRWGL